MLGDSPLSDYSVDQLMEEVIQRLQDDPRVGVIFLMSYIDGDKSQLHVNTKLAAQTTEALGYLTTALADTVERMAAQDDPSPLNN